MKDYNSPNKWINYFMGLSSTKTQNKLYRHARELKQGEELEIILENLKIRKALKFISAMVIDGMQVGNIYWGYQNGNFNWDNLVTIELVRFLTERMFYYADARDLEKVDEELHKINHQSWKKLIKEAGKNLDERI